MQRKPLTGEQAKARIRAQGITTTEWARRHGYNRRAVYDVLNGQLKARFGNAHQMAVDLGMKLPLDESSESAGDRNTQSRAAA